MPEKDHNLTQRELLLLDIMGKRFGEGDEDDFKTSITSPSVDEGLFYDGSKWVNLPIVGGSSISVSGRTISVNSTKESEWDTAFTHSQITTGNPHSLDTGDVPEAGNLYYTNERVDDRVSNLIQNGTGISWSYDDPNNTLTGNVSLSPFSTSDLSEGTNLYYTNARVEAHIAPDGDFQNLGTGDNVQFVDGSFSGNVTITGNLSVSGTTFTVDAQTVEVEDNVIVLNKGETGAGVTNGESGIRVDRGTSIDFLFVFDEVRDRFVVGKASDETDPSIAALQAVATRQDSPASGGIPFWNNTENRFDNSANATLDSSGNLTAVAGIQSNGNIRADASNVQFTLNNTGTPGSTFAQIVFKEGGTNKAFIFEDGSSDQLKLRQDGVGSSIAFQIAGSTDIQFHDGGGASFGDTSLQGYTALYANGTSGFADDATIEGDAVTVDGGTNPSSDFILKGFYDSDGTTGVISTGYDAVIRHIVTSVTPTGKLSFRWGGAEVGFLDDGGILDMTTDVRVGGTSVSLSGHTHSSANITDFNESVDDRVNTLLIAGTNINLTYDDPNNTLTIDATDTNDFLTGLSFDTGTGVLTATVQNQTNPTVDLDGRYSLQGHTHDATDITSGRLDSARLPSPIGNVRWSEGSSSTSNRIEQFHYHEEDISTGATVIHGPIDRASRTSSFLVVANTRDDNGGEYDSVVYFITVQSGSGGTLSDSDSTLIARNDNNASGSASTVTVQDNSGVNYSLVFNNNTGQTGLDLSVWILDVQNK